MEFKEKKIEISKEEKGKELSEKERKIVNDIYLLLSERKISPEKLSSPLKDLIIWEKPLKIEKKYYERNNYLNLPGGVHINVKVWRLEPAWIEIRIKKQQKDLFNISLSLKEKKKEKEKEEEKAKEELLKKIISLTRTLGVVEVPKEHYVVLKKWNFEHIKERHEKKFKKIGIETKEELIKIILTSIKKAQYIEFESDREIYYYQPRKGGPGIKTIVSLRSGFIISSYPII